MNPVTGTVCTSVDIGDSNCFEVKVGVHKRSALSPLLDVIVVEAISVKLSCLTMGVVIC